jgi:hypothetical protein
LKVEKQGEKNKPGHGDTLLRNGHIKSVKKYGTHRVIYRSMHREVTYRLIDYGNSMTQVGDVGDHIANDGGTEQMTEKEVGESVGAITITGNN